MDNSQPLLSGRNSQTYANLVFEIHGRTGAIVEILRAEGIEPIYRHELAHLQIRKVCEAIALACLCAHEQWTELQSKVMMREWNPDKIMARLFSINDKFFLIPCILEKGQGPEARVTFGLRDGPNILKQSGLREFWFGSGNVLHRGSLDSAFKKSKQQVDFQNCLDFAQKVQNTMFPSHVVCLDDSETWGVLCVLSKGPNGPRLNVSNVAIGQLGV